MDDGAGCLGGCLFGTLAGVIILMLVFSFLGWLIMDNERHIQRQNPGMTQRK